MDREQLKDILLLQNTAKRHVNGVVQRELLEKINSHENTPFIIIISGVRRCGKSTLLNQVLSEDGYYVNFDDERFLNFTVDDFQHMHELLIELFGEKHKFFFDEIQNIAGWERFVRRLYNQKDKVYITGSNASMLSKEMGTHLTGRNVTMELYPFSFREFLRFNVKEVKTVDRMTSVEKSKIKKYFMEYMDKGGFPEFLQTEKDEYLKSLYENVLYRDIITRNNLKSEKSLKETAQFAASNIGKEISFNSIKKITGLTSATTIREYFNYLENSYMVFLVPKYSRSLKNQIYSNKKVYFIDSKLAKIIGFRFENDRGRMLENVVFLQLKRNGDEIYYHKEKNECDFVIKKGNNIAEAIQVTWNLNDGNMTREILGIVSAMEKYNLKKGTILTYDQENEITKNGKKITVKPVWKWLLDE